ncbi:MAG TPA: hypothetical protein VEU72_07445 [Nitrosopumilaceae archaeon]|nr:hypothetical protein [Nitrosopumilaceae archaeon]
MADFAEHALKIALGLGLLIGGFILLIVWGVNTTTGQITNIVALGIGIILMIGGSLALKKL